MKKLMPLIILMVMALMLMISWSNISAAKTEVAEKYKDLLRQAERYEEKKIYVDAVKQYNAALKLKPDYALAMRVAGLYEKMDNEKGYMDSLETAISCDRTNPEPYFKIIKIYQEQGEAEKLYKMLTRTKKAFEGTDKLSAEQNEEIDGLLKRLLSELSVYMASYDEYYGFHRYEGKGDAYIKVRSDNKYGLLNSSLSAVVACSVDDIGYMGGGLIPILHDGEYYYIDSAGNRKVVTDSPASAIGAFAAGYAPVQIDGKYGYIDIKMKEYHFDYEFAGSFENGIAPVKQNGKWFVINKQFQPVGPNFDEILVDCYGFCSPYGVYFGKSGNSWGMYSTTGEKIADGFEDVKQFASTQPTAVKKNGKWGYMSLSGEMILDPQFENANPFSIGYAPVLENGLWGCINQEGEMMIDPQFKALDSFNHEGYAVGENAEGLCTVHIKQYN